MKILPFLTLLLLSSSAWAQSTQAPTTKRPNIVFIMSDDHAYQAISAYSNRLIETPNIDRIANAQGYKVKVSHDKFCVLPWVSLETSPIGTVRPCCLADDEIVNNSGYKFKLLN